MDTYLKRRKQTVNEKLQNDFLYIEATKNVKIHFYLNEFYYNMRISLSVFESGIMSFNLWLIKLSLKKKLNRLKRIFIKIYNIEILAFLRHTLIYNFVKILALIFLVLWIAFELTPQNAHVSYEATKANVLESISADYAEMNLETNSITISSESNNNIVFLGISSIEVDDKEFSSRETSYGISTMPLNKHSEIKISSLNNDKIMTYINSYSVNGYSNSYIDINDTKVSVKCPKGLQAYFDENILVEFYNTDAYLLGYDMNPVPIKSCTIKSFGSYIIRFEENTSISTNRAIKTLSAHGQRFNNSNVEISANGVDQIIGETSGDLLFYYTSTPISYSLKNQPIKLLSDHKLSMDYKSEGINDAKLEVSGVVNSASIYEISLFPSFTKWYRDNIYLAPLTLFTTIFGGVVLVKKK